jgi:hypothetical protein
MDSFIRNLTQLRHPTANILSIWIEPLTLPKRIEDAEIRLRIYTSTGPEALAAVVGSEIAVDQILHEISLAATPIEH